VVLSADGLVLVPHDFARIGDEIVVLDGGTDIIRNGRPARFERSFPELGLKVLAADGLRRRAAPVTTSPLADGGVVTLAAFPPAEDIAQGTPPVIRSASVTVLTESAAPAIGPDSNLPNVTGPLLDACGNLVGFSIADGVQDGALARHAAVPLASRAAGRARGTRAHADGRVLRGRPGARRIGWTQWPRRPRGRGARTSGDRCWRAPRSCPRTAPNGTGACGGAACGTALRRVAARRERSVRRRRHRRSAARRARARVVVVARGGAAPDRRRLRRAVAAQARRSAASAPADAAANTESHYDRAGAGDDTAAELARPAEEYRLVLRGKYADGRDLSVAAGVSDKAINVEIGRGASDLVLDSASVSRRHARLNGTARALTITDLGSSNGTSINGVPCLEDEIMYVEPGDTVLLGDVRFTVLLEPAAGGQRPQ
jgi:hypothetical protein